MAKKPLPPATIAGRHQVYLERLKAGYVGKYEDTIRRVDKAVLKVLQDLKAEKLSELNRAELKGLLQKLTREQQELYGKATEEMMDNFSALSAAEAGFETTFLATFTSLEVKEALDAYANALRSPIQATGEMLEPFVKDLSARQIKRVEQEILKSVSQGRTISQTVSAVRGTKKRNYQDGVLGRNWEDARTVIRTATQHVSQASREATWMSNSDIVKEYEWVSTLDGKTSSTCKSLDGRHWPVGAGPKPPIHPRCRSTTTAWFPPSIWAEGATRSAEFGPVAADQTYFDWLKDQSKEFQVDALGPTRAKLFRDGGLSAKEFSDLNLNSNFKPLTLEEMKKLQPNAFNRAGL